MEKTEMYQCQSYYDDENVLRDCTCGKCDTTIKNKEKKCEYDSFWDCHSNKKHCKKHFRII